MKKKKRLIGGFTLVLIGIILYYLGKYFKENSYVIPIILASN